MSNPYSGMALAVIGVLAALFMMNALSPNPKEILGLSTFRTALNLESPQEKPTGNPTFGTLLSAYGTPSPTITPPQK